MAAVAAMVMVAVDGVPTWYRPGAIVRMTLSVPSRAPSLIAFNVIVAEVCPAGMVTTGNELKV